jgi:photosystem II stability/assembly factor-like uncharacterized protein
VKKWLNLFIVSIATSMLSGCLDNGSPAEPPTGMKATAGDGKVKVEWTASSGVEYWLFTATDAALSALDWTGLANSNVHINAQTPFYMCGLFNRTPSETPYYFATNGRINGGPGGASSLQVNAAPHTTGATWANAAASPANDLFGIGYTSLTTCSNNALSASGNFVAVGANGAIFTSLITDGMANGLPDQIGWTNHTVTGFPHTLYAVTGYATNQNNLSTPALRWVAVGEGGASFVSTDAKAEIWSPGTTYDPNIPTLRALTQVGGIFWAVGDVATTGSTATILSSSDGITWTSHATGSTYKSLNGITHGTIYVAVGESGTILTSADGNTWTSQASVSTSIPSVNLRQVTSNGSIIVAVGDGGTIVTSLDSGSTWTIPTPLSGTPNLVAIATESQFVENPIIDPQLGYISTAHFVAVDSAGNFYISPNGITWTSAVSTGTANLNALTSSGFGFVAVGNVGTSKYAF